MQGDTHVCVCVCVHVWVGGCAFQTHAHRIHKRFWATVCVCVCVCVWCWGVYARRQHTRIKYLLASY